MLDLRGLKRRMLGNPLVKAVFSEGGEDLYLVGGYLRDLAAFSARSRDLDFAVRGGPKGVARAVARKLGGRLVELRKERMLRVCMEGGITLDFSPLAGTLQEDLGARDFTFNAMAWSPGEGLIDPHGGVDDISRGVVRCVRNRNFRDDPLRLLRAYRFSAQFGWPIGPATRKAIKSMSRKIKEPASERITLEFFRLLNSGSALKALREAFDDGILEGIISLSRGELEKNLKSVSKVDQNLQKLPQRYHFRELPQGLLYTGLLRLERLLYGSDLDRCRLAVSREIRSRVQLSGELLERYEGIEALGRGEVFDLFSESGETAADLLVLSGKTEFLREAERFKRIEGNGLVSAAEIMERTGLEPGPEVGRLLRESKRLQFGGRLRRKDQAVRWLRRSVS